MAQKKVYDNEFKIQAVKLGRTRDLVFQQGCKRIGG